MSYPHFVHYIIFTGLDTHAYVRVTKVLARVDDEFWISSQVNGYQHTGLYGTWNISASLSAFSVSTSRHCCLVRGLGHARVSVRMCQCLHGAVMGVACIVLLHVKTWGCCRQHRMPAPSLTDLPCAQPTTRNRLPLRLLGQVLAQSESDVQATVVFAAKHNLRLVIKNTGHDWFGRSAAAGSLLLWTHLLKHIEFLDAFVPQGSGSSYSGVPAVTVGAGIQFGDIYPVANDRKYVKR